MQEKGIGTVKANVMTNYTDLIKYKGQRTLTAKGYKFLSSCVYVAAKQRGMTRYHEEFKPVKAKLTELITSLIVDGGYSINEIKLMIKNRGVKLN